ncbi:hypothetical protein NDU88_003429 [Pleurodeles waltl]|uniref:Uncharacterized protein n=1 Tax=Pleurodeles waltl TaxID=8319 RepID=A0AAV7PCU7_PLEWA|nr:hypothetical protein NDU88_003429 [Pleurodeles waltl]
MAEYMKKASKNLQASQELQKQWHDQKAVLIQYQPGQKVWVLESVAPRALQDKWSAPHIIVEKKGEVIYLFDLGTARSALRVLHVNRLKPYYDRADLTLLMATDEGQKEESDPVADLFSSTEQDALVEGVVSADCLTVEQKDHCINLLGQFSELFSTVPGTTTWCEHTIDTGDSMPVKRTTRARDFPFGGWIPHALESRAEVFSRRMDANKPCFTQIVRLAFLDAAGAQEGPEGSKLDLQREGTSSKTKSPH